MSKTDSITLWKSRIQSRKLSGLKIKDLNWHNCFIRKSMLLNSIHQVVAKLKPATVPKVSSIRFNRSL